jgi:hypothetical protein
MYAIFEACEDGDLAVVRELVAADPKIVNARNYLGYTPLHYAASNSHFVVVEFLVENGAKVNSKDNYEATPLHMASWRGHLGIVEFLVSRGADVNTTSNSGYTPLDYAAFHDYHGMVLYLWQLTDYKQPDKAENEDESIRDLDHAAQVCLLLAECGFTSDMITFS